MVQLWDLPEDPQSQGKQHWRRKTEGGKKKNCQKLLLSLDAQECSSPTALHTRRVLTGCNAHRHPAPLTSCSSGASPSWADRSTDCSPRTGPAVVSGDAQRAVPRYKGDVPPPREVPASAHPGGWQVPGTNKRGCFELFLVICEREFCHVTRNCLLVPLLFIQNPNLHRKAF